ncbi:Putative fluoride ion transporter CrcB [Methanimicrococcus hongohii]|uniref:Fluoride-specific ion channel n=1 Tax=Methanimicrococcus hongohii TaxID=3028295 RepID=A0AA96V007_9EURY|nr:CrcB family protein [Methanimicrococcus sp. Hf6]WNY23847.1 Putative fluoride ion transporter CrcB [Methanimicrococcus sp. Hf6]
METKRKDEERNEKISDSKKLKSDTFDFISVSTVFSVLIGGFFGAVLRAFFFAIIPTGADIFVNMIGSFLIGFFMFLPSVRNEKVKTKAKTKTDESGLKLSEFKLNKHYFIGTGFLGGFTTFSYFIFAPFLAADSFFTPIFLIQFLIYTLLITGAGILAAAAGKFAAEKLSKNGNRKERSDNLKAGSDSLLEES